MKELNLTRLIVFVFVVSWLGVLPSLLIEHGIDLPAWFKLMNVFMTLGPLLGAVLFLYRANGLHEIKQFFRRFLRTKASLTVALVAIVAPIVISFLGSVLGFWWSGSEWPVEFSVTRITSQAIIMVLVYLVVNTEELVWRGIVFDKLYDQYGYLKSYLILIPIWGVFHLPLFLYPGGHLAGYTVLDFAFLVIPSTFILGWIYIRSNRSLFYVHVHHQLLNGVGTAFPLFPVFIGGNLWPVRVFCGLLVILALGLIWTHVRGAEELSKSTD